MHANHFRRLALAQGLLSSQPPAPAPEQEGLPSTLSAEEAPPCAAPPVKQAPDLQH